MLSGYAYFPPVETVLVPHTETAALASLAPQRRRRPYSRLRPHVGVVYPPPVVVPPVETTLRPVVRVASIRSVRRYRVTLSGIRPPQFVGAPVLADETTIRTTLVAVPMSRMTMRRRTRAVLLPVPSTWYLLLEDGSKILLEDGTGALLLG